MQSTVFIPEESHKFYQRYLLFFTGTFALTLVSFVASFFLFPLQSGLVSVFFTAFSLIPSLEAILEKNKNDIWQKRMSPIMANIDMMVALAVIFLSALIAYGAIVYVLPNASIEKAFFSQIHDTVTHTHLVRTTFESILQNRLTILGVFFVISLVYRVGSIFVLVWLASVWGVIYGLFFKMGMELSLPQIKHYMIVLTLSGFFSMILRTLGFITAGMAGVFISKAIAKYKVNSPEFKQVARAVFAILLASAAMLVVAVYWEYLIYNTGS